MPADGQEDIVHEEGCDHAEGGLHRLCRARLGVGRGHKVVERRALWLNIIVNPNTSTLLAKPPHTIAAIVHGVALRRLRTRSVQPVTANENSFTAEKNLK